MWLKGAGTSGQETILGSAGRKRGTFYTVLTGVANTSPRLGRRKV